MLRRQPERILINSLLATTVVPITGGVTIAGYGTILFDDILDAYCQCPRPCQAQITTVTVAIPVSCECPYEWPLTIRSLPHLGSYEVQQTFGSVKYYGYQDPSGALPLPADVATAIAANINADPNASVTASAAGIVITLTEKDCNKTHGFQAFTESGAVNTTTAHVSAILSSEDLAKIFPIKWGAVGSTPQSTSCGTYCVYHFTLRKNCATQDISQANSYNCYEQEVYFYVNNTLSNYGSDWSTEMHAAFSQLSCN